MTPQPLNSEPALGPVEGRGVAEIRADLELAKFVVVAGRFEATDAWHRLARDVPSLLAEVEAAHRFERSVAVEREALLAEVERLERLVGTMVAAANANAWLVQAVEGLADQWHAAALVEGLDDPAVPQTLDYCADELTHVLLAAVAPQPGDERCSATHQRYGRCDLRAGHDGRHTSDIGADGPDDPGYTWTVHGSVAFRNGPRIPS